jgi:putative oxidoreductase
MPRLIETTRRWYRAYARILTYIQHPFLLLIRLYWGWQFFITGRGKLMHLDRTADFFASLGIPMAKTNALMAGGTECVGGLLLLVGLASRVITVPLIVMMMVAYATAHPDQAKALFSDPEDFLAAPPFLFLAASLIVLLFGPGVLSADGLLKGLLERRPAQAETGTAPSREVSLAASGQARPNRRLILYLSLAAFGGLLAGTQIPRDHRKRGDRRGGGNAVPADQGRAEAGKASTQGEEGARVAAGPTSNKEERESHLCRGLNSCKGKGKGGHNACSGQGACATVARHACNGLNECKGLGGCSEHPGENQCKGQGGCAVPLKASTWDKARRKFEENMAGRGIKVGPAPAKG